MSQVSPIFLSEIFSSDEGLQTAEQVAFRIESNHGSNWVPDLFFVFGTSFFDGTKESICSGEFSGGNVEKPSNSMLAG